MNRRALKNSLHKVLREAGLDPDHALRLADRLSKPATAVDFEKIKELEPDGWAHTYIKPNIVLLSQGDYEQAAVRAFALHSGFSSRDFRTGPTRRDRAQMWADSIRGFLAETAVRNVLEKLSVQVALSTRRRADGESAGTFASDIEVCGPEGPRPPRVSVSIKQAPPDGRWLDLPDRQFKGAGIFILVLIDIPADHLLAFLVNLSLGDRLIQLAEKLRDSSDLVDAVKEEVSRICRMPGTSPIPAVLVGWSSREELEMEMNKGIYCKFYGKGSILRIEKGVFRMFGSFPETFEKLRERLTAYPSRHKEAEVLARVRKGQPQANLAVKIAGIDGNWSRKAILADWGSLAHRTGDAWRDLAAQL